MPGHSNSRGSTEHVTLKGGLTVPLAALKVAWELEDRGFILKADADGSLSVGPAHLLTDRDRADIRRWKRHLAALVEYSDGLQ